MRLKLLIMLMLFTGLFSAEAQIREREEAKPPATQRQAQPTGPARANVKVLWEGTGTVIIKIGDRQLTVRLGAAVTTELVPNQALKLVVERPDKSFPASEFLLIDPSGGDIHVKLEGNNAVFSYETTSEKRLREEIPRKMASDMVAVRGGTFMMGCTSEQGNDCDKDEKPAHSVSLSDFQIGKYEVTQAQWRAVMGSNPSHFSGCEQLSCGGGFLGRCAEIHSKA